MAFSQSPFNGYVQYHFGPQVPQHYKQPLLSLTPPLIKFYSVPTVYSLPVANKEYKIFIRLFLEGKGQLIPLVPKPLELNLAYLNSDIFQFSSKYLSHTSNDNNESKIIAIFNWVSASLTSAQLASLLMSPVGKKHRKPTILNLAFQIICYHSPQLFDAFLKQICNLIASRQLDIQELRNMFLTVDGEGQCALDYLIQRQDRNSFLDIYFNNIKQLPEWPYRSLNRFLSQYLLKKDSASFSYYIKLDNGVEQKTETDQTSPKSPVETRSSPVLETKENPLKQILKNDNVKELQEFLTRLKSEIKTNLDDSLIFADQTGFVLDFPRHRWFQKATLHRPPLLIEKCKLEKIRKLFCGETAEKFNPLSEIKSMTMLKAYKNCLFELFGPGNIRLVIDFLMNQAKMIKLPNPPISDLDKCLVKLASGMVQDLDFIDGEVLSSNPFHFGLEFQPTPMPRALPLTDSKFEFQHLPATCNTLPKTDSKFVIQNSSVTCSTVLFSESRFKLQTPSITPSLGSAAESKSPNGTEESTLDNSLSGFSIFSHDFVVKALRPTPLPEKEANDSTKKEFQSNQNPF